MNQCWSIEMSLSSAGPANAEPLVSFVMKTKAKRHTIGIAASLSLKPWIASIDIWQAEPARLDRDIEMHPASLKESTAYYGPLFEI